MRNYIFISIATTLLLFTSCSKNDNTIIEDTESTETTSIEQSGIQNTIEASILAFPKENLDEGELDGLMKMREEEKLAKDVYEYFYNKYEMKIFGNIAKSEEIHMFAIKVMIEKYDLEDPADDSPAGVFKSHELQEIYNTLISKGDASLTEALIVGAIIEDLDIHDLDELLENTSNKDLTYVYENLNLGSRNHLRAFYPQVLNNGGEYSPQYISKEEFDTIISSSKEYGTW